MELTRISEWYDRESGYIPQVGSDVIMQPLLSRQDWLILRFMDHFGFSLECYLNPSVVDRIITFIKIQRFLKERAGKVPCYPIRKKCHSDLILSAFSEWFNEGNGERVETDIDVLLVDIKVKVQDHLSADLMNPENAGKEYYILEFKADDDRMGIDIVLSRIDANRIISYEESRRALSGGLKQ